MWVGMRDVLIACNVVTSQPQLHHLSSSSPATAKLGHPASWKNYQLNDALTSGAPVLT